MQSSGKTVALAGLFVLALAGCATKPGPILSPDLYFAADGDEVPAPMDPGLNAECSSAIGRLAARTGAVLTQPRMMRSARWGLVWRVKLRNAVDGKAYIAEAGCARIASGGKTKFVVALGPGKPE